MSEWWTYAPRDLLMFSPDTYYRLFELHNTALWPTQIFMLAAGLAIIALLLRPTPWAGRAIAVLLAMAWAFVAWAYFYERYATINLAASTYAWTFLAQSILLLVYGAGLGRLCIERPQRAIQWIGVALFVFALLLQPLIGPLTGHTWQGAEMFGIAPDPTVAASLGVLLAAARTPWLLLPIPLLWCAITGATLWTMGAPEAPLMPVLGGLVVVVGLYRSFIRAES